MSTEVILYPDSKKLLFDDWLRKVFIICKSDNITWQCLYYWQYFFEWTKKESGWFLSEWDCEDDFKFHFHEFSTFI